jgi:hypothetical protein
MKNVFEIIRQTRQNFLSLVEGHSLATINQIPLGFNNNLIWNFGHALASQQLLVYRPAGLALHMDQDLVDKYRRGTKPDGKINAAELYALKSLGMETVDVMEADYAAGKFTQFEPYLTGYGVQLNTVEDALRFVPVHEALHYGYAMALKRVID